MARRVRIERTIVYEGDADWVAVVMEKSLCQPGHTFVAGHEGVIYLNKHQLTVLEFEDSPLPSNLPAPAGPAREATNG